jgi:hypothetical protein
LLEVPKTYFLQYKSSGDAKTPFLNKLMMLLGSGDANVPFKRKCLIGSY